jgi:hypothetical protein
MNAATFPVGKFFFLLLLSLLSLQACDSDAAELEKDKLIGNWLFEKGTIDGGQTRVKLLDRLTFNFTETEFSSNLLSAMAPGFTDTEPYVIEGETIIVKETLRIDVKEVTAGTLEVSLDIVINGTPKNYILLFSKVVG